MTDPALLHIYAQEEQHDFAYIIGNRSGLLALRDAVWTALSDGQAVVRLFTADGEGFDLLLRRENGSWQAPPWTRLHIGYTAPHAQEQGEQRSLYPWRLWEGKP